MKVVAFVPIKLNNQRLPGKNLKPFTNGEPLLMYTLRTLLGVKKIDEIYVYCSSEDVKSLLPNGIRFLKRDASLDSSSTKANDLIKAFCSEVYADIYIMSHITAPFIKPSSIEKGVNGVLSEKYDSAFSVKRIQDFFWFDGRPINYNLNAIPRTQDIKPFYMETSGFYIFSRDVFMNDNRRIGDNPLLVEVDEIESIDIDEAIDFEIADAVFNHLNNRGGGIIYLLPLIIGGMYENRCCYSC